VTFVSGVLWKLKFALVAPAAHEPSATTVTSFEASSETYPAGTVSSSARYFYDLEAVREDPKRWNEGRAAVIPKAGGTQFPPEQLPVLAAT
jgi:hypothetical protein